MTPSEARILVLERLYREAIAKHPDWSLPRIRNLIWRRRPERLTFQELVRVERKVSAAAVARV